MHKSVSADINTLFQTARTGDREAEKRLLEGLFVRFRLFAYQKVWDEDEAAELAQEALVIIAREYSGLEIEKSFAAWAYRVLENRLMSYFRTRRVRREALEREGLDRPPESAGDPQPDLKRKLLDCLRKVGSANRRYARILNLHYQGFSTGDVCRKLRMTANHSYVMLSRARDMLERCLDTGKIE